MTAPSIEYGLLSPALIVFGVAVAGCSSKRSCPEGALPGASDAQPGRACSPPSAPWSVCTEHSATPAAWLRWAPSRWTHRPCSCRGHHPAGIGAGRAADRRATRRNGFGCFGFGRLHRTQASAVPGSVAEQVAVKAGVAQTEVFPLTMFSVGGIFAVPGCR